MAVFKVERPERRKEIKGYGGRYSVSDLGRVYSGQFELGQIGGRYVNLSWQGEVERVAVAYLVARAFLGNPLRRPYVVHKDGDVRNNRVENLEWSEVAERGRVGRPKELAHPVLAYDLEGEFVGKFGSVKEASEKLGVARNLIRDCALGRARRAKQWIFRFENL